MLFSRGHYGEHFREYKMNVATSSYMSFKEFSLFSFCGNFDQLSGSNHLCICVFKIFLFLALVRPGAKYFEKYSNTLQLL